MPLHVMAMKQTYHVENISAKPTCKAIRSLSNTNAMSLDGQLPPKIYKSHVIGDTRLIRLSLISHKS